MPKFRTALYAIWKAAERLRLRPPGVREAWDDNDVETQARILSYSQIRDVEEVELAAALGGKMTI